jgi:hypothetical protein
MKHDMGGAAIVTGALALAILRGLDKRVKLILCCAENLVSGHAYKLGDILTYKNGTTVEIVNTDAEGRLVLADGLQLAGESGAPLIIDAATLTGAAVMALGGRYNALFGLDKGLVIRMQSRSQPGRCRSSPGTASSARPTTPIRPTAVRCRAVARAAPPTRRVSSPASSAMKGGAGCTWIWPPVSARTVTTSGPPGPTPWGCAP